MYKMIYDDGKIRILVATEMTYDECVELKARQISPECYFIVEM